MRPRKLANTDPHLTGIEARNVPVQNKNEQSLPRRLVVSRGLRDSNARGEVIGERPRET